MRGSRVIFATILGFLCGIVCWRLAASHGPLAANMVWSIIFSRTLIGFVIGISAWKIFYLVHGIILGFVVSLPMALATLSMPERGFQIFLGTLVMGMIYGFLIELITHLVIKDQKVEAETSVL
jgi:hypothetical protein